MKERRRHPRTTLRKPVLASAGTTPVFILDASRGGLRVAHSRQLPDTNSICRISLPSENGRVDVDCAIVRTIVEHANQAAELLFHSGLRVIAPETDEARRMREACGVNDRDGEEK